MKKIMFIVNPCSGKIKIRPALLDVIEIFNKAGYSVEIFTTLRQGHATSIASNAGDDVDIIALSGGDGTLNEVITGILQSGKDIPIGYIPSGSTNDFASTFGIQTDIKKAAKAIVEGEGSKIDVGFFNGERYFSYIASFGMFTSVSYSTPQSAKNAFGHMAYIFGGIMDIANIVPYRVKIETDDKIYEDEYIFGSVTNTTSVGGIVKFDSALVNMSDGLFETVLVKNPNNLNDLNQIIGGLTSSNFSDNNVFEFIKSKKIKMTFSDEMDWSLDGEHEKTGKEVVIENKKTAITIIK